MGKLFSYLALNPEVVEKLRKGEVSLIGVSKEEGLEVAAAFALGNPHSHYWRAW